jgi:hypothetical protein
MSMETSSSRRGLLGLAAAVRRLGVSLASVAEERLSRAAERYRLELRRVVLVMALSLAAALLGVAALAFLALTVMLAFWSTHPVAAAASIAIALAALSIAAGLIVRRRTGGD